ncbi:MAG: hypothetical protein Q9225_001760 [Loekoesia sp. 1 TL-2023]
MTFCTTIAFTGGRWLWDRRNRRIDRVEKEAEKAQQKLEKADKGKEKEFAEEFREARKEMRTEIRALKENGVHQGRQIKELQQLVAKLLAEKEEGGAKNGGPGMANPPAGHRDLGRVPRPLSATTGAHEEGEGETLDKVEKWGDEIVELLKEWSKEP